MGALSRHDVARIRKQKGWSQQYLAQQSGVNKAYISEYETGIRDLPEEMANRLVEALLRPEAGRVRIDIEHDSSGRAVLVLHDADGNAYRPSHATVQWTEPDGSTYSMFVGDLETPGH